MDVLELYVGNIWYFYFWN